MATCQHRRFKRRLHEDVKAQFRRFSSTGNVRGKPASKASKTACCEGALTKSRHAAKTDISRAAARNTVLLTARAGDAAAAVTLLSHLSEALPAELLAELRGWLAAH